MLTIKKPPTTTPFGLTAAPADSKKACGSRSSACELEDTAGGFNIDPLGLESCGCEFENKTCVAKTAVMKAGWDESVAGVQLDRFCASGLEAVNIAAQKIASGWEDLVVAGGVECMSRVPMGANGGA